MISSRMKAWRKVFIGVLLLGVAIQFVRPSKNDSPAGANDLMAHYPAAPEVRKILEVACYDCHSNHTRYPWYARIEPVGWWLANHINDGKSQLNFSEFASYTEHRRAKKLQSVVDEVTDRSMPLSSYTWIHREAKLTDAQIKLVADWADALAEKIEPEK